MEELKRITAVQPVLIFTTETKAASLLLNMQSAVKVTRDTSSDMLRQSDKILGSQGYGALVVDDPLVMRGSDFLAPSTGLALVLDRGLQSDREVQQALGRVGRFGERCKRYTIEGVDLIDRELNMQF